MVYATPAGDDPTAEALTHLGTVRVATKYPDARAPHFARHGTAVEVVKVNGSVELGPAGRARPRHRRPRRPRAARSRENGLVEREEIFASSARLIANRVSHKLAAGAVDGLIAAPRGRFGMSARATRDPAARRGRARLADASAPPPPDAADRRARRRDDRRRPRTRRRRAGRRDPPLRLPGLHADHIRVPRADLAAAAAALDAPLREALLTAVAQVRALAARARAPRTRR